VDWRDQKGRIQLVKSYFYASPRTKRYGWGIHSGEDGRITLYGMDSEEYVWFVEDETIPNKKAMQSRRT